MDLDSISLLGRFIPIMGNTLGHIDDQTVRLNRKGTVGVNKIDFGSKFMKVIVQTGSDQQMAEKNICGY